MPWLALAVFLPGCVVNPVTGERDLKIVSAAQEIAIGQQQYLPSQQMQGGSYELDQELTRYVQGVGQRLAAVSDNKLPYEFVVLTSGVPNAWCLPGGKIAINRGLLLELNSEAELAAVLGHEIVHGAASHSAQQISRSQLAQIGVMAAAIGYGGKQGSDLVIGGAQAGAALLMQRYGREAERESDRYGMIYMKRAGYDPTAAIALQETFVRLSQGRQSSWLEGLFASHPPSQERVENNKKTLAELGAGGEMGRERYQQVMTNARRTAKAYEAYDKGRRALAEGKVEEARRLADEAIKGEPREGLFHLLLGDTAAQQDRYGEALPHYDRAVSLNDRFFANFLHRGMSRLELGQQAAAENDLKASMKLLPTSAAANALGRISLNRGDLRSAREYFAGSAGAQGPAGEEARGQLARIDLTNAPGQVLKARAFLDGSTLAAEVGNPTSVAVSDIVVEFQALMPDGRVARVEKVIYQLGPGQSGFVSSGINVTSAQPQVRVQVVRARPAGQ